MEEEFIKTFKNLYNNNLYYKKMIDDLNINIDTINELKDIKKLPYITKNDLLNDDWVFTNQNQYKIYHASSGTTGKPLMIGLTNNDLIYRNKLIKDAVEISNITKDDTIQICLGFGMFTGGLGFYEGFKNMGCKIIPTATLSSKMQLYYMDKLRPSVLVSSPSQVMHIYEVAKKLDIDVKKFNIRIIKVGSELLTESMRKKIKNAWGKDVIVSQDYGMTETMGPGVASECEFMCGMHINENFIFELVDPVTKKKTNKNIGELVLTTLNNEGFPLIKYLTNDIVKISYRKCKCGRTTPRIVKVIGRADDMIKVKGVKIYLSQVEEFLMKYKFLNHKYEIILTNEEYKDKISINIEYYKDIKEKELNKINTLQENISKEFKTEFGIFSCIKILNNGTLEIKPGKIKRIFDNRIK